MARIHHLPLHLLLFALPAILFAQDQEKPWEGNWHSFWRGGEAAMLLTQEGNQVTGFYEPGDGAITGVVEGGMLRGTWEEKGARGGFVYTLSAKGDSFTGNFGNGEYWNGKRVDELLPDYPTLSEEDTPREALRTLLILGTAAERGDVSAILLIDRYVAFEDAEQSVRESRESLARYFTLLRMSTVRISRIPDEGESGRASYRAYVAGTDWFHDVEFVQLEEGNWVILIPKDATTDVLISEALEASGSTSMEEYFLSRRNSPRGAMRAFLQGTKTWKQGGRARALATMNLSQIPPRIRTTQANLNADYLRHILDKTGYMIYEEIPNNPHQLTPYVHFRHAEGNIAIGAVRGEDGTTVWQFTPETLAALPQIYRSMLSMPVPEWGFQEALSGFFHLRNFFLQYFPGLLSPFFQLEIWQWLVLLFTLVVAFLVSYFMGWFFTTLLALTRLDQVLRDQIKTRYMPSFRILVGSLYILWATNDVGLPPWFLSMTTIPVQLLVAIGLMTIAYRVTGDIGRHFYRKAEQTSSTVDEIVTSLTTGLAKTGIILASILVSADLLGLPYEGVIAGLGVGGLALAIASRDTVANFIGAAHLVADRPFKKGDLIEVEGQLAVVEEVCLRLSKLRRLDDSLVTIPNSRLSDSVVVNLGKRRKRLILLELGLLYQTPREKLDEFVDELKELTTSIEDMDNEHFIGLKGFGSSSIDIECRIFVWAQTYGVYIDRKHFIIGEIINLANRVGVEFAFPTRTLYLSKEESGKHVR